MVKKNKAKSQRSGVTRRELNGGKLTPPENPPDVSFQPWYPITLILKSKGETTYTYKSIIASFKKQVDPTGNLMKAGTGDDKGVVISKIKSIRSWNLDGKMIGLTVFDFITNAKSEAAEAICGLMDTGTNSHIPAVGFQLPASHANFTLRNGNNDDDDDKDKIFCIFCGPGDIAMTYVHMYWRCDGPSKLLGFSETVKDILVSLRSHVERVTYKPDDDGDEEWIRVRVENRKTHLISESIPVVPEVPIVQLATRAVEATSNDVVGEPSSAEKRIGSTSGKPR